MSINEQEQIKEQHFSEAMRYVANAKECLIKAEMDNQSKYYNDPKYVRMACGTAYSGILIALDAFMILKGVHKPTGKERKSIEYYQKNIGKIDKKLLNTLDSAYKILHLSGYYDGIRTVDVIKMGFSEAKIIIDKIKPTGLNGTTQKTAPAAKATRTRKAKTSVIA